jgi:hypothetical protein
MSTSGRPQQRRLGRARKWSADLVERLGRRFDDGETSREIADSLGVSKSAIASLLWRSGYMRKQAD